MCGADQTKTKLSHLEGCLCPAALMCQRQVQVAETYPGDVVTMSWLTRVLEIRKT
jgi:hypothetical protein